LVYSSRITIAT